MRIKLDLHVHTHHSFDSKITPDELAHTCAERGLAGVAVTDHDAFAGAREFQEALPHLLIIPGEEVRSRQGEIIGLFISREISPGMSALETMQEIRRQGGLVCLPHPFDPIKLHRLRSSQILKLRENIDCLEAVNGKPRWPSANREAEAFARTHGFPVTAGSDAHRGEDVGRVYLEMEEFDSPQGFLANLREATTHGSRYSPWASQLERWKARLR
jgi:predicted metal-dependent phosphoesterase TrpH